MRYAKMFSLAAGMVIGSISLQAQTVNEILDKYTAALGGTDKLKAIKTQYTEGEMTLNAQQGLKVPVRKWVKQDQAMRMEFDIQNTKNIQVVRKDAGWQYMPVTTNQNVEEIDPAVRKLMQPQLDVTGELFDIAGKGKKVELAGKETLDGGEVYKLKVTTAEGLNGFAYLDANTFYLVKATNEIDIKGHKAELITRLSDYRKTVDGYAYPAQVEQTTADNNVKIRVNRVEVNQPMADSLFEKPAAK
ncbi:hypothetical protein HF324_22855 [Chitinophaga oryzae]|uniref:Outer membrane lipoprotein-sorting protein n=1 Tax=Chitinophaga oryzae TaxID=2725414 RepID=A0ABX6LK75_9BACT|nr:hypothetical protein [Chitinophaga oryzae]QJB40520.1 hypothetical protein HF324_22855 [Chitinophaga oryzae]